MQGSEQVLNIRLDEFLHVQMVCNHYRDEGFKKKTSPRNPSPCSFPVTSLLPGGSQHSDLNHRYVSPVFELLIHRIILYVVFSM